MDLLKYELLLSDEQLHTADSMRNLLAGLSYAKAALILDYLKLNIEKESIVAPPEHRDETEA